MDKLVKIVKNVRSKDIIEMKYYDLFEMLAFKYSRDNIDGCTCYEYFNSNDQMVKPHIDYEEELNKFDKLATQEIEIRMLEVLEKLFKIPKEEWAISDDSRLVFKDKKTTKFKISLHFVCYTKKCDLLRLGGFIENNMKIFKENKLPGVDTKIYRKGINKFRMPMTKKNESDEESLLTPHNFGGFMNFHKHLVQLVDGDDITELELPDVKIIQKYKMSHVLQQKMEQNIQNYTTEIQSIIDKYTVISCSVRDEEKFENCLYYDIKEKFCGRNHQNNNNFLSHNKNTNVLKVKCHSDKCQSFERTLYNPPPPTKHFDIDFFHNIPIPDDEPDNYKEVRKYFEYFFVFIRDNDSYYRIKNEWNTKYEYFEKSIQDVRIRGYRALVYKRMKSETEIETVPFLPRYQNDPYKSAYLGICFQPYSASNTEESYIFNGDYNLFDGFQYNYYLSYEQKLNITEKQKKDFSWYLNYIKKYICGLHNAKLIKDEQKKAKAIKLSERLYDYLMAYLANILQNPTKVPHIILCFYSSEHGTGKSGFTKYIGNCIGSNLVFFGSYDEIMEKHTNAHVGKLLNVIEECNRRTSKKYECRMKDYSQRQTALYNEKNKPQRQIKTYVRYIKTTNDKDGIYFDAEDRRYVVYTFTKMKNPKKVEKLLEIQDDRTMMYLFGLHLTQNVKIKYKKQNDWQNARPLTSDYYHMRELDPITQFFKSFLKLEGLSMENVPDHEYLTDNKDPNIVSIAKETFYKLFTLFFNENNCLGHKYKSKKVFVTYISINLKNEIQVVKFESLNTKNYYKLNLKNLWNKYYEDEKFINYHTNNNHIIYQHHDQKEQKEQKEEKNDEN